MTHNQNKKTSLQWGEVLKKVLLKSPYDEAKALKCIDHWAEACKSEGLNINRFKMRYSSAPEAQDAIPQAILRTVMIERNGLANKKMEPRSGAISDKQLETLVLATLGKGVRIDNQASRAKDHDSSMRLLHLACSYDLGDVFQAVLKKRGPIKGKATPEDIKTLIVAASLGRLKVIQGFKEAGLNVDVRYTNGETALMRAISTGQFEVFKYLLEQGANPSLNNSQGQDALFFAADQSSVDFIKLILSYAPDLDAVTNFYKETACHRAAWYGHFEHITCLVEAGADFERKDRNGDTPLDIAQKREHLDTVNYLTGLRLAAQEKAALQEAIPPSSKKARVKKPAATSLEGDAHASQVIKRRL